MAKIYKTPGVYIEEIAKFPPSIAPVETAIPAFIGYTEKAMAEVAGDLRLKPTRISSLVEYESLFGKHHPETGITVDIQKASTNNEVVKAVATLDPQRRSKHILYYAMHMFFANGGGPCYIVSIGTYLPTQQSQSQSPQQPSPLLPLEHFIHGLDKLREVDEPTLIVIPESQFLDSSDLATLNNAALTQCSDLQDRFVIMDVPPNGTVGKSATQFRNLSLSANNLKYGAAYAPNIATNVDFGVDEESVQVTGVGTTHSKSDQPSADGGATPGGAASGGAASGGAASGGATSGGDTSGGATPGGAPPGGAPPGGTTPVGETSSGTTSNPNQNSATLAHLKSTQGDMVYQAALAAIRDLANILPPSAAIAGMYAAVDGSRGVWKAPANVSLKNVIAPAIPITNTDQETLNIDPVSGKSINAIRAFTGKGTLVWGARTLAGNDNEWKYVNVRRFFIFVEESVKKATEQFVFEANDRNTWVKVQGMIENFLTTLWRQGALQGVKPEHAFYVSVGLGTTMTALDILEGRMIVEIGLAAVRPAEFIILKFSHKMAES